MSSNPEYDRFYAARHVRILMQPKVLLETFGSTFVNYHLISELDDYPGKVRIREGHFESGHPLVITPGLPDFEMEGFSDEAREYFELVREQLKNTRVVQYGFHLKSDNFSEQVVTDSLAAVTERVKCAVAASHDAHAAVLQGVDEPWDVALVELWRRQVSASAGRNIRELNESGKLFGD